MQIKENMKAPVDVVWMLGKPGATKDWELRLSMRSFEKNYQSEGCCFWIIGHIPAWIARDKVKCLEWPDPYKHHKDSNLIGKAIRLAGEATLSDPFILCSDDHLLLKPATPEDFLNWHCGDITTRPSASSTAWNKGVAHTGKCLREAGYPAKNYEGHVPYLLQKSWCFEALRFPYSEAPGMTIFSTILNAARVDTPKINSAPIRGWIGKDSDMDDIDRKLEQNMFATLDNSSPQNPLLVSILGCMFHDPAEWEEDKYVQKCRPLDPVETKISVVIPLMNRNDRLAVMLPSWANHPMVGEVIIADWSSDPPPHEDCKIIKLLESYPKIKIIRNINEQYFNMSMAENLGLQHVRFPIIAKIDVDIILLDPLWLCRVAESIARNPKVFHSGEAGSTFGSVIFSKSLFDLTEGYREDFEGWGNDDGAFFNELQRKGGKRLRFEKETVRHIPHDDKLRTENFAIKNNGLSWVNNKKLEADHLKGPPRQTYSNLEKIGRSVYQVHRHV